jgi:hypothetical protein
MFGLKVAACRVDRRHVSDAGWIMSSDGLVLYYELG